MTVQPGSGCGRIHKEDVVDKVYLMQAKSTRKNTIVVKYDDLRKVCLHAEPARDPAFAIGFILKDMFMDHRIWIMMPLARWQEVRRR